MAAIVACNIQAVEGPVNCGGCAQALAVVTCGSCKTHFCADCDLKLHDMPFSRGHVRVPLGEASPLCLCQSHGNRVAWAFCSKCDIRVCELGNIQCLEAAHKVVTLAQLDVALQQRLEAMHLGLPKEHQLDTAELDRLEAVAVV